MLAVTKLTFHPSFESLDRAFIALALITSTSTCTTCYQSARCIANWSAANRSNVAAVVVVTLARALRPANAAIMRLTANNNNIYNKGNK